MLSHRELCCLPVRPGTGCRAQDSTHFPGPAQTLARPVVPAPGSPPRPHAQAPCVGLPSPSLTWAVIRLGGWGGGWGPSRSRLLAQAKEQGHPPQKQAPQPGGHGLLQVLLVYQPHDEDGLGQAYHQQRHAHDEVDPCAHGAGLGPAQRGWEGRVSWFLRRGARLPGGGAYQ